MNGLPHSPIDNNRLRRYHSGQAVGVTANMNPSPALSNNSSSGGSHMARPVEKKARYVGGSDKIDSRNHRQPSAAPSPSQVLTSQVWGQHQQQLHTSHNHQDFPTSPTARDNETSAMDLALGTPPAAGAFVGGCSPDMEAYYHGQQEQPHQQSIVGAVIAEAVARRSLSSQSQQQQQQQSRDMDVVRRGTPMSENRRAMAEPRLLWSELDVDGPSVSAVPKPLPQEGGGGGLKNDVRSKTFSSGVTALRCLHITRLAVGRPSPETSLHARKSPQCRSYHWQQCRCYYVRFGSLIRKSIAPT